MSKAQLARRTRPKAADFLDVSEQRSAAQAHPTSTRPENPRDDDDDDSLDSDGDKDDLDVPRVAQWIDDDDFELQAPTDEDSGSDPEEEAEDSDDDSPRPSRTLQSLEDDLSTLPLGTLRTAQRSLAQTHAFGSDTDSESPDPSDTDTNAPASHAATKGTPAYQPSKPTHGPTKRANKHAPTVLTSKRPVSRRRTVVADTLPKPRDPRFMHAAGRFDPSAFTRHYDFLPSLRTSELHTLREHLTRARKQLLTSPAHLRADRAQEVDKLARTLKRAESAVNMGNREHAEREALEAAKRTEKEKRKQGKAGWWMKQSEKRALLAKARMDAVASVGGKRAVKKALEKKQKKISQKEKRMRPFPRNEGSDGKKRRPVGSLDTEKGSKRRKVA